MLLACSLYLIGTLAMADTNSTLIVGNSRIFVILAHSTSFHLLHAVFTDDYVAFLGGGPEPETGLQVHCSRAYDLALRDGRVDGAAVIVALLHFVEDGAELGDR
jgi:hypothetical protein